VADYMSAFRKRLLDAPAVASIVGTKISWMDIPQTWVLPYVRLQVISEGTEQHLKGFFSNQSHRIRIEAMAREYDQSVALAKACRDASLGPTTIQNVVLGRAMIEAPRDMGDMAGTFFVHRRLFDCLVPVSLA